MEKIKILFWPFNIEWKEVGILKKKVENKKGKQGISGKALIQVWFLFLRSVILLPSSIIHSHKTQASKTYIPHSTCLLHFRLVIYY